MPEFEFDPGKSAANQTKHGIDFVAAQNIWRDLRRIEVPARTSDESKWMVIGRIADRCWSAVVTYRDDRVAHHLGAAVPRRRGGDL
ncbi:BrnT family toxin [Mycobacterium sp. 1274756.6]|uniref:BrnT family toxin n=1 Tax=Mycobacterium sp. 1274756.6 TaxID=1834076 RepID=UPI000A88F5F2|nr:BrnT family toxin [Mycobacterium sp. 1274756.6]